MGATDHARTRDPVPVRARHCHIEGEDMNLDVMTVIVGGDSGDGVHQRGIHIGPALIHALAPPFVEEIVYRQGVAHLATSVVGLGMGEQAGALGLGVTRCDRVGRDQDLLLGLVHARDHIPLTRGTVAGVGRNQLAVVEEVLAISGIAGRGHPRECYLLSWLIKTFCNVTDGIYNPEK